jgi:hypothetical protein
MAPLLLVCSLCLPVPASLQLAQAPLFERAKPAGAEEVAPPAPWQSPALVAAMSATAIGGDAIAATRGFTAGRIAADQGAMIVGSLVGIGAVAWGSFVFGPKEGGLLLPLSERKLIAALLIGGVAGSVGGLAAAEAIGGHLNGVALLGGAGGFLVSSGFVIALIDGIFGLPVWANAIVLPLGLTGGAMGGYALAHPR